MGEFPIISISSSATQSTKRPVRSNLVLSISVNNKFDIESTNLLLLLCTKLCSTNVFVVLSNDTKSALFKTKKKVLYRKSSSLNYRTIPSKGFSTIALISLPSLVNLSPTFLTCCFRRYLSKTTASGVFLSSTLTTIFLHNSINSCTFCLVDKRSRNIRQEYDSLKSKQLTNSTHVKLETKYSIIVLVIRLFEVLARFSWDSFCVHRKNKTVYILFYTVRNTNLQ